jgi:hypothetical protein
MSTFAANTALCIIDLCVYSSLRGIPVGTLNQQCSLVSAARNILVRQMLQFDPKPTHVLWIDSVTPDTPILVRKQDDPYIDFIEACEFIPPSERFERGRTYHFSNYEVLTHQGWQKPRAVMQAKVQKPILRVTDELGTVSVTEDHSLFSNGEAIAGRDIREGTVLDHVGLPDLELPNNLFPPVTEEYAEVLGFFAAEGTAGRMHKSDGSTNGWFWSLSQKDRELLAKYGFILESVHARRFIFVEDIKVGRDPVWKLCPSYPSEIAPSYFSMFYTPTGKKRVPKFILNAPLNIVNAFLRGYEIGDGHNRRDGLQCLTTNSKVLAAGLHLLNLRAGRNFAMNPQRPDKPDIINMVERRHGLERLKSPPGVRHIQRDDTYDGWVYDLNTEAGTFVGGVGLFVLHNSDMMFPQTSLERLLIHDKPVACAFYNKRVPPYPTVGHLVNPNEDVSQGGLFKADIVPHGLALVKREVYETLPQPWYYESYDPAMATESDPTGMVGEDVNFSRDCVKNGIEMWCDADLTFECAHIGEIAVPCLRPDPLTPPEHQLKLNK